MSYTKLDPIVFGKKLLITEDLDPIYVMLHNAHLTRYRLKRWLLAYWWFYHAGVASHLSGYRGGEFFEEAHNLAKPEAKTPRGTERRHFRGDASLNAISYFHHMYSNPEDAVDHAIEKSNRSVNGILDFVKEKWPLFGPWIGFKMADMIDRLDLAHIKFPTKTLELYQEPRKGAELFCKHKDWDYEELGVGGVVKSMKIYFQNYTAPPRHERMVGVQEIETILCKWKSHMNGHYPVGKDIKEIRHGLKGWGPMAKELKQHLPKEVE